MFRIVADDVDGARAWFDAPGAAIWREHEAALLAEILPELVGYRCIHIGVGPMASHVCERIGTLRFWRADIRADKDLDVCIDGQNLPLASGSVDALIVAHALELSRDPHGLVRECARVLSPRGQLVCLAFNPLSIWAFRQMVRSRANRFSPRARPPRAARLTDWLRLLDFETTACLRYGPGFPLFGRRWQAQRHTRWLGPLAWAAGGYALVARRRVPGRIPPSGGRLLAAPARGGLARTSGLGLSSRA